MNNNPYPNQQPPSGPYPPNPNYPPQGQPGPYTQYPPQQPGYPPAGYPQGQPPMQQPPQKKKNKLAIGCGAIIALVVLIAIISAVSNGSKSSANDTTSSSSNSADSANSTNNSAPSKPQTWQTTHTYTGNGTKKTETIAVADDWKIQWSCTPGSFDGIDYNVIVAVYNSDGTLADPGAINTICKTGNASGETEEHTGGNVYLDVNSEGDWSLTIQELK